jgi:hypothetical protein
LGITPDYGQDAVAYAMEGNMLARLPPDENDDDNGDRNEIIGGRCVVTEIEYCLSYGECIRAITAKFVERSLEEEERIRALELDYLQQFD